MSPNQLILYINILYTMWGIYISRKKAESIINKIKFSIAAKLNILIIAIRAV